MDNMQAKTEPLFESKMMDVYGRASGQDGRNFSAGILPWYLAQPALPEVKYALTVSGYVILPKGQ